MGWSWRGLGGKAQATHPKLQDEGGGLETMDSERQIWSGSIERRLEQLIWIGTCGPVADSDLVLDWYMIQ